MKDINLFALENSVYLMEVGSKSELDKNDSCDGYLIRSSESEARRIIDSLKGSGKKIAFVGGDSAVNRRAIETLKIDYLVSLERDSGAHNLKQRDSGFNHVLAKEAKRRGIRILVDMSELRLLKGKELAIRLEQLIQNVKIARKAGCSLGIVSLAESKKHLVDSKARMSFGFSLGMNSSQARDSVSFSLK